MNEAGNYGGSDPGETEATLLFASPKFKTMPIRREYECPTSANEGTLYDFYDRVEQQDLVPTLSALMGLPIPRNSIGRVMGGLLGVWQDDELYVDLLGQNVQQLWKLVDAVLGRVVLRSEEAWPKVSREEYTSSSLCKDSVETIDRLACLLKVAEQQTERSRQTKQWYEARIAYEEFLTQAQRALIDGNRPFSLSHMTAGIATCALALLICIYSIRCSWPSGTISIILASRLWYSIASPCVGPGWGQ
jgi:ethanolaminephosphotransferase